MKKYLLGAVALCFLMQAKAQDTDENVKTRVREVGLTTTGLTSSYGLTYRVGNEKMVWRFNALSGGYNMNENEQLDQNTLTNSFNLSTSIGLEFRKPISEKLTFRYGVDLGIGFRNTNSDFTFDSVQFSPQIIERKEKYVNGSVGAVLGMNYAANDHIIIGIEVVPSVGIGSRNTETINSDNETMEYNYKRFFAGFQSSPVLLSAVVRF